jgi:hypothetical protein
LILKAPDFYHQWNPKSAMNEYLIQIRIPGAFFKKQFPIFGHELRFGFQNGWITDADVVDVLVWWWDQGQHLSRVEQEIAGLTANELWQLPGLLEKCQEGKIEKSSRITTRIWMYLILAWLYKNRNTLPDPLDEVIKVYEDFEHPKEIESLIKYMPLLEGEVGGEEGIMARWKTYLNKVHDEFVAERMKSQKG